MLQEVIDSEYEHRVDIAESALLKATASGEPWAVRFTLQVSPWGKKRGYGEQTDVNVRTSPTADIPTEELEAIIRERQNAKASLEKGEEAADG